MAQLSRREFIPIAAGIGIGTALELVRD